MRSALVSGFPVTLRGPVDLSAIIPGHGPEFQFIANLKSKKARLQNKMLDHLPQHTFGLFEQQFVEHLFLADSAENPHLGQSIIGIKGSDFDHLPAVTRHLDMVLLRRKDVDFRTVIRSYLDGIDERIGAGHSLAGREGQPVIGKLGRLTIRIKLQHE